MTQAFTTALPDYCVLAVRGDDAQNFLQGQLTCDMRQISAQKALLGCYCNLKGRVIALLGIVAVEGGYDCILPSNLADTLIQKLKPFAAFSKSTLEKTDQTVFGYVGKTPSSVHIPLTPESGFFFAGDTDASHASDFYLHMIQQKIPVIDAKNTEQFLPHYIHLVDLGAVNFKKGCYVGQEIIARMHYKANLKKHVLSGYLEGEHNVEPGTAVTAGDKNIGEVVNSLVHDGKTWVLCSVGGDSTNAMISGQPCHFEAHP